MEIRNLEGRRSGDWCADVLHKGSYLYRVSVWHNNGVQHIRMKSLDGKTLYERVGEKGRPWSFDDIHGTVIAVAKNLWKKAQD